MGEVMDANQMQRRGVILFPVPEAGHMNPMFHLAAALHSKGISITFILTKYNAPNPSDFSPNYTFHFIDDGIETRPSSPVAFMAALNANCMEPFRNSIAAILGSQPVNSSIAGLITDPFWKFTRSVCEEFKLPRIMLHTSTIADLVILTSPNVLQHEDYSLYPVIIEMVEEIKASSALICNSFQELEGSSLTTLRQYLPELPIFPIGPLHKYSTTSVTSFLVQDKSPIMSWLDSQAPKSVLYVSFGSLATISEAEFLEIAWGLANSRQPFLWVIRGGLVQGSNDSQHIPEGFSESVGERGHIVTWAPQQEVLAHPAVGGSFLHGGWNSTLESISEGVPIICMPCLFPDQKTIAKHVSDVWRIGLRLEKGAGRGEVESTIRKLMAEKDGEEIRIRMASFKSTVISCLAEGGSSYESLQKLSNFLIPI